MTKTIKGLQNWAKQNANTCGIWPLVESGRVVGTIDGEGYVDGAGGSPIEFDIINDEYAVARG